MNFLAIETSTNICSVALFNNNKLIKSDRTDIPKSHSKELAVMIKKILNDSLIKVNSLNFIALSSGPGSFTGLRIGSSVAKGIAYSLSLPIVMVPTLHSLAIQINSKEKCSIALYSHKNNIYIQDFNNCKPCSEIKLIEVNNGMKKTLYGFELEKADESLQFIKVKPSAESIGILAIKNYKKWLVEDLTKAKLNYITNLKIN